MLSPVERAAQAAWKPQDIRQPWEWCEDHVEVDNTSPFPGKWKCNTSPWVREVMEVAADKSVTFITVKCSAQSSKTQTMLNLLMWDISEDPGPEMYVLANADDAKDFAEDRFKPMMEMCEPVYDNLVRESKLKYTFRTMPLYFVGAGSMSKLQGKPIKRLKLDEVRNYPPGALETVLKRVRAYADLAQVFLISTPDKVNDPVDRNFKAGDQRTFHFPCPHCATMQQLRLEQIKAVHPETGLCVKWSEVPGVRVDGRWNFDALAPHIRYQCCNAQCGHLISDTPTERKSICRTGRFIRMNPSAPKHIVSFTWSALLPWWVSWRSIVEEFVNARMAARNGDVNPLKTFTNETLGESWEDRLGVIEDFGFLEARKSSYYYGEVWAEEKIRFMAADKQEKGGEHYWYAIRAFGDNGKSRLIVNGKANTKEELEEIRIKNNVLSINAIIDSGYMAQEVYRFCAARRWKCFKGDQAQFYLVPAPNPTIQNQFVTVRQMWRKTLAVVYHAQTKARIGNMPLFTFAGEPTTDLLMDYMTGLVGDWTLPADVEREYLKQLCGERRMEHQNPRGIISYEWHRVGDNHYLDCERMIKIAAIVTKWINAPGMRVNSKVPGKASNN